MDDKLYPTREAAEKLRKSEHTLNAQRSRGEGPTFVKLGGRVFYRGSDLDAYVEAHRFSSTAEARDAARRA
jgi:hypothetical protein